MALSCVVSVGLRGGSEKRREDFDMPLTTSRQMLLDAQANHYAVGAFNVENLEMFQSVIAAAEKLGTPVMLQTTSTTLKYAGPELFAGIAKAFDTKIPFCLHLDHGDSFELCMRALRAGYTSVMIDGSRLPLDENIALVKRVTDACKPCGIPVEAELGKVGGKEDDMIASGGYTDPKDASVFVEQTGVDSLAVAIGTAHGVYKGTPHLDLERLIRIRETVDIPLVLHGASGVPESAVRDCVRQGICKVNYATELRQAYTHAIRDFLSSDADAFDPKLYGKLARSAVIEAVIKRITLCGTQTI